MSTHVTGKFTVKTWDETTWDGKPWKEVEGAKLTHAVVTKTYLGEIEGEGTSQTLTTYNAAGSASYVGLEQVVGRVGGRSGSFVFQVDGTYDPGTGLADAKWSVVPGSGTGDLSGLRGTGGFVAEHGNPSVTITLDYDFE
jgi:hypothetical protein